MQVDSEVLRDLAPTGALRAAINFGNSVLAQRNADKPGGVSVDLATELARRLGVDVELIPFDAAGQVVEALKDSAWDVAFLAIDPRRAEEIFFTPAYVRIEGNYLVRDDSPVRHARDVDRAGIHVATGKGAAYELFLTRNLKQAQVKRFATAREAMEHLATGAVEVAAGVRQVIEAFARERGGMRLLSPSFIVIDQALATPAGREVGLRYLRSYIEEQTANGFVADALKRSGQGEATVANPHST